jgi:hypothetical protein
VGDIDPFFPGSAMAIRVPIRPHEGGFFFALPQVPVAFDVASKENQ